MTGAEPAATKDRADEAKGRRLLEAALVWDNHVNLPIDYDAHERLIHRLGEFRTAGVDVVSLNVGYNKVPLERQVRLLAHVRRWIKSHVDGYSLVETVADIRSAKASGRLAVTFDIEGMDVVEQDPSLLGLFYDLGVRWMLIAYNTDNLAGGGCYGSGIGLTRFGRDLLDEMAALGMVPCCSHTSERTAYDVLEHCAGPVIFSHSNPAALVPHPRNVPDDLIRRCAASGGVVGICGHSVFLGAPRPTATDVVRHIDYVVQLVGPDHVGISLDIALFDDAAKQREAELAPRTVPPEYAYTGAVTLGPEVYPAIADELVRAGYAGADIAKILGGNFLRVAEAVWKEPGARSGMPCSAGPEE